MRILRRCIFCYFHLSLIMMRIGHITTFKVRVRFFSLLRVMIPIFSISHWHLSTVKAFLAFTVLCGAGADMDRQVCSRPRSSHSFLGSYVFLTFLYLLTFADLFTPFQQDCIDGAKIDQQDYYRSCKCHSFSASCVFIICPVLAQVSVLWRLLSCFHIFVALVRTCISTATGRLFRCHFISAPYVLIVSQVLTNIWILRRYFSFCFPVLQNVGARVDKHNIQLFCNTYSTLPFCFFLDSFTWSLTFQFYNSPSSFP